MGDESALFSCGQAYCNGCWGAAMDEGTRALAIGLIEERSPQQIQRLIDRYPGEVTLNSERGAIQIEGCGDRIVAHIPLGAETVTALVALEQK